MERSRGSEKRGVGRDMESTNTQPYRQVVVRATGKGIIWEISGVGEPSL